jgi:hypothetical protein
MKPPFHLVHVLAGRLFNRYRHPQFSYAAIVDGRSWACTDLGAFRRPLPLFNRLEGVVVMEDRSPTFFLSFHGYTPDAPTDLNRHGPLRRWSTQRDLKDLVAGLHEQGIKVAIGFWNYGGWWFSRNFAWLRGHPELRRVRWSSDLYPFVRLRQEGVEYAEYIGGQYASLAETFRFDGLMLADGLCGFGTIVDPDMYADQEDAIPRWTRFYQTVAGLVHQSGGILLAYDHMGAGYLEARRHGVDYRDLARAGLDVLVYQSYPQAWGNYWLGAYRDRFDLRACAENLATIAPVLSGIHTRVLYTVELGDSVEKWAASPEATQHQIARLDPMAGGRFLVWANDLFAHLPVR